MGHLFKGPKKFFGPYYGEVYLHVFRSMTKPLQYKMDPTTNDMDFYFCVDSFFIKSRNLSLRLGLCYISSQTFVCV